MSEVRAARALALLNMAMHDAAVGCWDDEVLLLQPAPLADGSRAEDHHRPAELPVLHLRATPRSRRRPPKCCRTSFPPARREFEAQKEEASISRLYGGIHYRSDIEVGKSHGKRIGGYTVSFARTDGASAP